VCDHDEVTEVFFGLEDEPDARFVQLEDCKHVFEVSRLSVLLLFSLLLEMHDEIFNCER